MKYCLLREFRLKTEILIFLWKNWNFIVKLNFQMAVFHKVIVRFHWNWLKLHKTQTVDFFWTPKMRLFLGILDKVAMQYFGFMLLTRSVAGSGESFKAYHTHLLTILHVFFYVKLEHILFFFCLFSYWICLNSISLKTICYRKLKILVKDILELLPFFPWK